MATSYGTIHNRPSASSSTSALTADAQDLTVSDQEASKTDNRIGCFIQIPKIGIPTRAETAAVQIIRNLGYYGIYYVVLAWLILFVSVVPRRRISLIFLIVMSLVTSNYLLLLKAMPSSRILQNIIDKRLVLLLLLTVTVTGLIITHAIIHLLVSLAIALPLILLHAILVINDGAPANGDAAVDTEMASYKSSLHGELQSSSFIRNLLC